ncbi:hypothetical protein E5288_WYG011498 [Bos mutus]|uniref:Uncharacterized protein n=1 Tax=Bos mutus TaxID=72004 RepID=A0A6B0RI08_9CETA|nr:hypothetical protein [Bos mutus]
MPVSTLNTSELKAVDLPSLLDARLWEFDIRLVHFGPLVCSQHTDQIKAQAVHDPSSFRTLYKLDNKETLAEQILTEPPSVTPDFSGTWY